MSMPAVLMDKRAVSPSVVFLRGGSIGSHHDFLVKWLASIG